MLPLVLLVQDALLHLLERLPRGTPLVVLPVREERGQAVQDVPAMTRKITRSGGNILQGDSAGIEHG